VTAGGQGKVCRSDQSTHLDASICEVQEHVADTDIVMGMALYSVHQTRMAISDALLAAIDARAMPFCIRGFAVE
jgi:hypothetical protein